MKDNIIIFIKHILLFFYHFRYFGFSRPKNKRIIFFCDGVIPHGGWVDRLKGIISYYDVAQKLNYDFKLVFTKPFEIKHYLIPNKVEWDIRTSEINFNPLFTKIIYSNNNFNRNPLAHIINSKKDTFIVYSNVDYLTILNPELNGFDLNKLWKVHFQAIFKPTNYLKNLIKPYQKQPYSSIHARFTSLMGDFSDTSMEVLSKEKKDKLLLDLEKIIFKLTSKADTPFYIMSDSKSFLDYIPKSKLVKVMEGNPIHMDDFKNEKNLKSHERTLIDFFVLAGSKNIFLVKLEKMYYSNFSRYAAILGNGNFKLIDSL
jgi:hypothetical protein